MLSRRSDLPLERDALNRFLPWLIAFMVFMAVLALAGVMVFNGLASRWDAGVSATMTVQIPPSDDDAADDRKVAAVLELLRAMPDVATAEAMPPAQVMALLEPWLGTGEVFEGLPVPRLIDVELVAGTALDAELLRGRLAVAVAGVAVDDHGVWLDRLVRLVRAVEGLAAAVLVLMAVATAGTVVFTTRTSLAVHQEVIELLHLMGAHDSYIARQFATRALYLGLRGGIIGLVLGVPTLIGLDSLAARLEGGMLPELSLGFGQWLLIAALPLAVGLVAMVTARLTVTRSLAGML